VVREARKSTGNGAQVEWSSREQVEAREPKNSRYLQSGHLRYEEKADTPADRPRKKKKKKKIKK